MKGNRLPRRALATALLAVAALAFGAVRFGVVRLPERADVPSGRERLVYSVSFLGIDAGVIEFADAGPDVRRADSDWTERPGPGEAAGVECRVVEMRIDSTNALLEAACPIHEVWRSFIDPEGGFSRRYELARRSGSKSLADEQTFDYRSGIASWKRTQDGAVTSGEVELTGPVQDMVSWIYYLRERIAAGDREVRFTLVERGKVLESSLAVSAEEEIDLCPAFGRVRALRASGSVGFGGLSAKSKSKVDQRASHLWFDAATGILLKADIAAKVGSMGLRLVETENAPARMFAGSAVTGRNAPAIGGAR